MNGRFLAAIAASLLIGVLPIVAQPFDMKPNRVTDPYRDEHFSCEGQPDGRFHNNAYESFGYNGFRIVADLNFDGRPDLILSAGDPKAGGCGAHACSAEIYLMQSDKTYARIDF